MKPILQALLVADHVYTDKDSGKKIIAGVLREIHSVLKEDQPRPEGAEDLETNKNLATRAMIPHTAIGSPYVFISITEVTGQQEFELRFVDLKDDSVIYTLCIKMKCDDPLRVNEVLIPLPQWNVKRFGAHAFELLWKDEPLGMYRVNFRAFYVSGANNE